MKCFVLWLMLCPAADLYASPRYTIDHITSEDGLPQSSVRAVAQDNSGFLWVGTEAGLSRYDGYQFKKYAPPFGHGIVSDIHMDSRGRIWVAWYNNSVTVYDPAADFWRVVDVSPPRNFKLGFMEDPTGTIWLSDGGRLSYFDETAGEVVTVVALPFNESIDHWQNIVWQDGIVWVNGIGVLVGYHPAQGSVVARIVHDSSGGDRKLWKHNGSVWLCNQSGVLRVEGLTDLRLIYDSADDAIFSCSHGPDDTIWIGTQTAGAIRVDSSGTAERFVHRPDDSTSIAANAVFNIQQDSQDQMWLITAGTANLFVDDRFVRFEHSPGSSNEFLGGSATSRLFEDRSGVIWLGSEGAGLARVSRYKSKFHQLMPPSDIDTHVRKPVVDKQGDVWIGMQQDGVYRWGRETGTWTRFDADPDDPTHLPTAEVRAMLATSNGDIWAGSREGIVSRFDRRSGEWQRYSLEGVDEVFNLLEHPGGQIIVGRSRMLTTLDPTDGSVQHYPLDGIPHIRATALSRTGNVYVGTHQGPGVVEFVPGKGFARQWSTELSDTNVFSLYEDHFGFLWIGTWGGGLNRLDPDTRRVQVISNADGLPDDTVFGILPGDDNDLWISTYSGLARIDNCINETWPCDARITSYDSTDGLPTWEFDAEAHLRAPNGELFFGGSGGFVYFHPKDIESNPVPPKLQFTELRLNDESLLSLPGFRDEVLLLEADFGTLALSFSALDFHNPKNNEFKYRLGPSANWISIGPNPDLILNNLGTGRYSIEVMGTNSDGLWSARPLSLKIRVLPPTYLSLPAVMGYIMTLSLMFFMFVRFRERNLTKRSATLESMVEHRTRDLNRANAAREEFYANVSHEIRTPLTLLLGAVQRLDEINDDENSLEATAATRRHVENLIRYVDNLITVSHLNSAPDIEWFAEDIVLYLRSIVSDITLIAGRTAIVLHDSPTDRILVRSYPNALNAIFSNLLVNALRYTPEGGQIDIAIDSTDRGVIISIADSGPGIDDSIIDRIFERGVRGRTHARNITGFGIGLTLVKQTIHALGGQVEVRNNIGKGACFEVRLAVAEASLQIASYESKSGLDLHMAPRLDADTSLSGHSPESGNPVVLIVEDHLELRNYICDILRDNYSILQAATAEMAIMMTKKHVPDVVICDVMLPDEDGFEVLRAIKTDIGTDHIAVMMLTALADEESKMKGLLHRADAYLTKPFRNDVLKTTLSNLLRERRVMMRYAAMKIWRENTADPDAPTDGNQTFELTLMSVLEAVYDRKDCSVDDIAKMVAVSRRQLERKTRFCFDRSPNALLSDYRLDKAAKLLRKGFTVVDVAFRCGFGNQSYFGAVFKKRFGMTPSDYASEQSVLADKHESG